MKLFESKERLIETKALVDNITSSINKALEEYKIGSSSYAEKFKEALSVGGEAENPTEFDYIMHYLSLPLKLLAAAAPPTE